MVLHEAVESEGEEPGAARGASNFLVLSPAMDRESRAAFFEMMNPADPAETRVLAVNYSHSFEEWVADWREFVGRDPAEWVVVSVGETVQPGAADAETGADTGEEAAAESGPVDRTLETPGDLTGLGITISEYLSEWTDEADILLTVDSLTVMLQSVDLKRAFRFVHVMTNRSRTVGARSYYHMDPTAHDDQTVVTLASLFDEVLEYAGDGQYKTRS